MESIPELAPQLIASGLARPRGLAFDGDGHLWIAEEAGSAIVRVDAESREMSRFDVGGGPRGLAIDAYGRVWFSDVVNACIRRLDPEDKKTKTITSRADGECLDQPHDLIFDARGNLVFTCFSGNVCCVRPGGETEMIANELTEPSSLALVGHELLLILESGQRRIWRGSWSDDLCHWIDDTIWAQDLGKSSNPTSFARGVDGKLYLVLAGEERIIVLDHDGMIVENIPTPGLSANYCAFDPAGAMGLVLGDSREGSVYSIPALGPGALLYDAGAAWSL
ncbi:MAG: hypothetical protein H7144_03760 [Burkholderiales bacterium]|nr:hypothetical protein [Phycisphaerae bacterium]